MKASSSNDANTPLWAHSENFGTKFAAADGTVHFRCQPLHRWSSPHRPFCRRCCLIATLPPFPH